MIRGEVPVQLRSIVPVPLVRAPRAFFLSAHVDPPAVLRAAHHPARPPAVSRPRAPAREVAPPANRRPAPGGPRGPALLHEPAQPREPADAPIPRSNQKARALGR